VFTADDSVREPFDRRKATVVAYWAGGRCPLARGLRPVPSELHPCTRSADSVRRVQGSTRTYAVPAYVHPQSVRWHCGSHVVAGLRPIRRVTCRSCNGDVRTCRESDGKEFPLSPRGPVERILCPDLCRVNKEDVNPHLRVVPPSGPGFKRNVETLAGRSGDEVATSVKQTAPFTDGSSRRPPLVLTW